MASPKEKSWFYSLAKRRPYGLVLIAGIGMALAFPPISFFGGLCIGWIVLLVLFERGVVPERAMEDRIFLPFKRVAIVIWRLVSFQMFWRKAQRGKAIWHYAPHEISGNAQLFRYSYATFFIWNAITCYWLMLPAFGASNLAEGLVNGVAAVMAIALNPLLMSIPLQLHARMRRHLSPDLSALALVVFWLAFEFIHLNWELSWPWLTLGNALTFQPGMIQYAEFTGVLGISAQLLLLAWLGYVAMRKFLQRLWLWGGISLLAIVALLGLPIWVNHLLSDPSRAAFHSIGQLHVRIVQPNIDPYEMDESMTAEQQISRYSRLILSQPLDSGTVILLPEKAIPMAMEPRTMLHSRVLAPLWDIVDSFHVQILTGLEDVEDFADTIDASISARENYRMEDGKRELVYADYYNSAWVMDANRNTQVYRKGKLVPMVERVPFLRGLRILKFLHLDPAKGFDSYGRPDSLQLMMTGDSIPTNVMICYESAFGDQTRRKTAMGAQWIAMITNDGWWRNSSGYMQHAGLANLRAIENRRAVARCANTGRSEFVNADGTVVTQTNWATEDVIDADIPRYTYQTFYVRHGDYIGVIACLLTAGMCLLGIALGIRDRRRAAVVAQKDDADDFPEKGA